MIKSSIKFQGYNLFIKQFRSDKGWRVEIDVSEDQYKNIINIPLLPEAIYNVEISPEIKEEEEI